MSSSNANANSSSGNGKHARLGGDPDAFDAELVLQPVARASRADVNTTIDAKRYGTR